MPAFVDLVSQRFRISTAEAAFLEQLQAHPARVRRGHRVATAGQSADHAFVLMTGWAMSYSRFPDDACQIRRLHFPGDLLAMPSVPMKHHAEDIETLSDAVVSPFPKQLLADLFAMPRLTAIMYMFAQVERITAGGRLANLGHNSAKDRIAFLLCNIVQRLRSADSSVTHSFYMHLTREQVAQFCGITPVHASRMWSALLAEGLISSICRMVTIEDEQALRALCNYRALDDDFDYQWLKLVAEQERTADVGDQ
jgi:CRP/FNR family transcriptional regulator, anaerobic regulatory protein